MKKIFIVAMMIMVLPLVGCRASGSLGESSSIAESITHIC